MGCEVGEHMIPECSQQGFTKTITDVSVYKWTDNSEWIFVQNASQQEKKGGLQCTSDDFYSTWTAE